MKNYRLVKEDPHSFLIHDGKEVFHIAKKPLGPDMHKKIRGLPAYADGGEVEDDGRSPASEPAPESDSQDSPSFLDKAGNAINDFVNGANDVSNKAAALAAPAVNAANDIANKDSAAQMAVPATPDQGPAPASIAQPSPDSAPATAPVASYANSPMASIFKDIQGAQGQQLAGVKEAGAAQAAQAKEQADAYNNTLAQQKKIFDDSMARRKQLDDEASSIQQAYASQKLDPNRLWHNASTGSKIGAALAMIVSGIGAGKTGQQNMAMAVIQKNIDRDIQAQMNDQSKTMNLYKFNRDRYNNEVLAEQATRLQMNAALQGQLAAISSKYAGQMAQANVDQVSGQLRTQQDQLKLNMVGQMAKFQAKAALVGGNGPVNEEMLDEKDRERIVQTPLGPKLARQSSIAKDTGSAIGSFKNISDAVDEMRDLGANHWAKINSPLPSPEKARFNELSDSLDTELNQLQGLKRLTHEEMQKFETMSPSASEFLTSSGLAKLQQLKHMTHQKLNTEMRQNLEGSPQVPELDTRPAAGVRKKG